MRSSRAQTTQGSQDSKARGEEGGGGNALVRKETLLFLQGKRPLTSGVMVGLHQALVNPKLVARIISGYKAGAKLGANVHAVDDPRILVKDPKFECAPGKGQKSVSPGAERVGGAMPGATPRGNLADPGLRSGDQMDLAFRDRPGQLFADGVSADDVQQGKIGDCYFAAALSAVAASQPQVIQEAIQDQGNGTYRVRFFRKGKAQYVTIDGDLPQTKDGGLQYARGANRSELWVPLMEKAYAQWKGGYNVLDEGGRTDEAISHLTGRKASQTKVKAGKKSKKLIGKIKHALQERRAVTASIGKGKTRGGNGGPGILPPVSLPAPTNQPGGGGLQPGGSDLLPPVSLPAPTYQPGPGAPGAAMPPVSLPAPTVEAAGLVANHSYVVLSLTGDGESAEVALRNPWGHKEYTERGEDGIDDGRFSMPFSRFTALFTSISVQK